MSRLIELITRLCPDGVEYRTLGEVIDYEQPTKYIVESTNYNDDFTIPVLTAGNSFILGYTNETKGVYPASKNCPVIIFDDFTTSFHWVDFIFKVKSSAMKLLTIKDESQVTLRFLYFAMKGILFEPSQHARHWIQVYSNFRVPIPPLPVQQEIVRILDKFTTLEEELEEELEARKKQYEYYRDSLLTSSDDVARKKLGEIAQYSTTRIKAQKISSDNYVGVDNLLPDKRGKVSSSYVPSDGGLIEYQGGDILIGNIRPYLKKIWLTTNKGGTNGDVLTIRIKDEAKNVLSPFYLYYVLASDNFFNYDMQHSKGAKMPRGDKTSVMRYSIPVPSLEEQKRIVAIFDRFDALVNDITQGLPAEIAARRKQYEYYRNKLLTFKETA